MSAPADLAVETVDIDSLTYDPENARVHSDRQLDAIAASLREFGQRRPLVVTKDGIVVAGNGTLKAARRLGWKAISITRLPFKDRTKARAFAIADNRTSDLAAWDDAQLLETLSELEGADLLGATGWTFEELDDMKAVASASQRIDDDARNVAQSLTREELADRYLNKVTRQFVLEMPNEVYVWMVERLPRVRGDFDSESNAEAFVALVADHIQEEPPSWITA